MLPVYVLYFAGGNEGENGDGKKKRSAIACAGAFVLGFTLIFVALGAISGALGRFLIQYRTALNIVTGIIVIIFGLNYVGVFKIGFLNRTAGAGNVKPLGFFSSLLFGIVFSISWTPCVGAFLGSALMLASQQGNVTEGILLLLVYSAGLGIPFMISAVAIDYLHGAFNFIKQHYRVINTVCGILLICIGILMATGLLGRVLTALA